MEKGKAFSNNSSHFLLSLRNVSINVAGSKTLPTVWVLSVLLYASPSSPFLSLSSFTSLSSQPDVGYSVGTALILFYNLDFINVRKRLHETTFFNKRKNVLNTTLIE